METVACYRHGSGISMNEWSVDWSLPLRRPSTVQGSRSGSDRRSSRREDFPEQEQRPTSAELQREPTLMDRLRDYQERGDGKKHSELALGPRQQRQQRQQPRANRSALLRGRVPGARRTRHTQSSPNLFSQPSSTFREVAGFRVYVKDPVPRTPFKPGDACEIYLRASASWVRAVCLELKSKGVFALCAYDLSQAGKQWVRTDSKTSFRATAQPERLSHILRKCWVQAQTGTAGPEHDWASTSKVAGRETLDFVAGHGKRQQKWSSQGYSQLIRIVEPTHRGHAQEPHHVTRGSASRLASRLAGTQEPSGIGESTIEGIRRVIIDKVEQNSMNIRPVFRRFDDDKSGQLSYAEFRKGLLFMGLPLNDREFALLCKEVDNDGSGEIDYGEFVEDMKSDDQDRAIR
eukprot:COSAG02_NODE_1052_length_14953_cov_6.064023_9_plen_404_part_00